MGGVLAALACNDTMKPPKSQPARIITQERRNVAQALINHDRPITAAKLCAEVDDLPFSEILEHLRVLCAAGIVTEPIPRRIEITPSGAKLLQLQLRVERATEHPHI